MAAPHVKNAPKGILLVWDETTKDYVVWDGSGTPAITGFATETTLTGIKAIIGPVATLLEVDSGDSTIKYIGKGQPGTNVASAEWQIQRMTKSATGLVIEFADGNSDMDNVWDDRESLSYS